MRSLTVLYPAGFELGVAWQRWLARQPQRVRLEILPRESRETSERFGLLEALAPADELTTVSDDGAVYWGDTAYVLCFYALEGYREWALRLAAPASLPLARSAFILAVRGAHRLPGFLRNSGRRPLPAMTGSREAATPKNAVS